MLALLTLGAPPPSLAREERLLELFQEEGTAEPAAALAATLPRNSVSPSTSAADASASSRRAHLPTSAHSVNLLSSKQQPDAPGADSIDTTCHSLAEAGQGVDDQWCIDNCSPHSCPLSVCSHGCQDMSGGLSRAEVAASVDDATLPQEIAATMPNLYAQPGKKLLR